MNDPAFKQVRLSVRALTRYFDGFVASLKRDTTETRGTYTRALREFLRWFPHDPHFRFRVKDVRRYKHHLASRRKLSAVSVSTYLTALRRFCAYLVDRKVLEDNPAHYVGGNSRPATHSRDFLNEEEVLLLLTGPRSSDERGVRDHVMMLLMLQCGLSEIELVRADVRDLADDDRGRWMMVQGKGRKQKDERVLLPPETRAALEQYLRMRGQAEPGQPLFASAGNRTRGQRMTTRGVRDRINTSLVAAGLKQHPHRRITPFSLRHTAAVLMARRGATADELRERLRLGSLMTARLYLEESQASNYSPTTSTKEDSGGVPLRND
jgi:site-specific recombinase XerD